MGSSVPVDSVLEIIKKEGHFAWCDGASIYTMKRDHTFTFTPVGISGRAITGKWRSTNPSGSVILVFGQWSWINGRSPDNDFRKIRIHLRNYTKEKVAWTVKGETTNFHKPYFVVEELSKISKEEYEQEVK